MSPFENLLQSFSQSLPPGSTIYILAAELPDGRTVIQGPRAEPSAQGGQPLTAAAPPKVPNTPLARVAALRIEHGPEAPLKLSEWAIKLGVSRKELRRATKAKALAYEKKTDGRDNKAHMVTIGVMESYLKTTDAVQRGEEEAPIWWNQVHRSSTI